MGNQSGQRDDARPAAGSATAGRAAPSRWGPLLGLAGPVGASAAAGVACPWLGAVILLAELTAVAVIGAALLGSGEHSKRAFRLLHYAAGGLSRPARRPAPRPAPRPARRPARRLPGQPPGRARPGAGHCVEKRVTVK